MVLIAAITSSCSTSSILDLLNGAINPDLLNFGYRSGVETKRFAGIDAVLSKPIGH